MIVGSAEYFERLMPTGSISDAMATSRSFIITFEADLELGAMGNYYMTANNIMRFKQQLNALARAGVDISIMNSYLERIERRSAENYRRQVSYDSRGLDPIREAVRDLPTSIGNAVLNSVENGIEKIILKHYQRSVAEHTSEWTSDTTTHYATLDNLDLDSWLPNWREMPWVIIIGAEAAAELGIRGNIASGIIFDSSGNFGIIDTLSVGAGNVGLSAGGYFALISAPTIHHVAGGSIEFGAVVGRVLGSPYVGVEWTVTTGSEQYHGIIISAGKGIGSAIGVHTQLSFSNISSTQAEIFRRILPNSHGDLLLLLLSRLFGN